MSGPFELRVAVSISSNEGHGTLNVFETHPIRGGTFKDVAEILARFHKLGEIIRGELAEQEEQAAAESSEYCGCLCGNCSGCLGE